MKRIVLYYSLTENTTNAAETIAKKLGADLCRIETVKPMPKGMAGQMFVGGMQATFGMKPKLRELAVNTDGYEEIILGTPVWAGKPVPAIHSLLESEEIRKKITAVFTCSGGGDNDSTMEVLQKKLPNLRINVPLADRRNKAVSENESRIEEFVEKING